MPNMTSSVREVEGQDWARLSIVKTGEATSRSERRERGEVLLRQIGGTNWDGPINRLAELSKDFAEFTIAYPYGDILSRPGLTLRLRQICTVSSLLANGSLQPQLRFHMNGLLNAGGTVQDLVELLVLSTAIVGFPVAIDGIAIVRAILKDRDITYSPLPRAEMSGDERRRRGEAALASLLSHDEAQYTKGFSSLAPVLARWAIDFAFGDVLSREGLDQVAKFLAITSMLATVGNRADELRNFIRGAAHAGVERDQLIEAAIQLSAYAGFPAALNFFGAIGEGWSMPPAVIADMRPEPATPLPTESTPGRRDRGLATLGATSAAAGDAVVHGFDDIAPEIGAMIVEHSYGDIFSRPGLDPKTRELTACAALAGSLTSASETPFRVHVSAALAAGATSQEIVETLLNVAPYRGFPAVQRAIRIACRLFAVADGPS